MEAESLNQRNPYITVRAVSEYTKNDGVSIMIQRPESSGSPLSIILLSIVLFMVFPTESLAASDGEAKDWLWIPAISYGTDTGWLAGSMLFRFYGCEEDVAIADDEPACRRSSVSAALLFTQKQQLTVQLGGEQYWSGQRHRLFWRLGYRKFPTTFYGIGRDSSLDRAEDFTPREYLASLGYTRRMGKYWELGLQLDVGTREYLQLVDGGMIEVGDIPGSESGSVAGLGLILLHDRRDSVWFPLTGHLHSLGVKAYRSALGSDYDWDRFDLNLRQYLSLRPLPGASVLALQLVASHARGDAPFYHLPSLGGENELRGYPGARWRDHGLLLVQAELRTRNLIGPLGAVLFVGYGDVAPRPADLDLGQGKLGWGGGLRYLFDPETGLHLRMDIGQGEGGESNFTITIGEAY